MLPRINVEKKKRRNKKQTFSFYKNLSLVAKLLRNLRVLTLRLGRPTATELREVNLDTESIVNTFVIGWTTVEFNLRFNQRRLLRGRFLGPNAGATWDTKWNPKNECLRLKK